MKANARHHGKVTVVDLSGKITIGDGDIKLRQAVNALLDEGRKNIILNLGGVSYMDSAGIGELVACHKRAVEKGGVIKILKPNEKLLDLFTITKLIEIFDIYDNEKDALKSF